MNRPLNIAFIHPDLGLGGAERLVVDAALSLQSVGHHVTIFTAHHDRTRCFEETSNSNLDIRVHGDFLPRHVGQHLHAVCAIARMAGVAVAMARCGERFDLVVCDLVAHVIPLLHRCTAAPVVFYGHFPDQLLARPGGGLYRLYRAPINRLENLTVRLADRVLVNSRFTATAFRQTFPHMRRMPEVLYPGVDVDRYARATAAEGKPTSQHRMILSLTRYERSKNVALAIDALALMRDRSPAAFPAVQLVVAGGYDDRLAEHRETLAALQAHVTALRLNSHVVFRRSVTDAERLQLLSRCCCLVHTSAREHFGYVPIEAMAAGRPVVAVNSAGPTETVRHGETGFLCAPTSEVFAEALGHLITDPEAARRMGDAARQHVATHFSRAAFGARLDAIVREVAAAGMGRG